MIRLRRDAAEAVRPAAAAIKLKSVPKLFYSAWGHSDTQQCDIVVYPNVETISCKEESILANLSPMMQQYLDIKAAHKDHVLFFRLGDFYEMFFDDAVKISKELELTLTGRDCGLPERAPMCGIPYHSAETYIKKLIERGYKVAICEQLENPALAKGLVKRDVVRLITPGTVIENSFLNEERNNYIASIVVEKRSFSVCFADISTGDVYLTQQKAKDLSAELIGELSRFSPSEILFNEAMVSYKEVGTFIKDKLSCVCEMYTQEEMRYADCAKIILSHFAGQTLEQLGIGDKPLAVQALGALIRYIGSTQKDGAKRLSTVKLYREDEYMGLDLTARRNLELTETMRAKEKRGTLLWVLDRTKTAMGKRYIRKAVEQPLMNAAEITKRQTAIRALLEDGAKREEIRTALSHVYDLERLMTRVIYGTVNPRELRSLAYTLAELPMLKALTETFSSDYLSRIHERIEPLEDVCALIENAICEEPPVTLKEGGVIRAGFNQELDDYHNVRDHSKEYIAAIEEREREATGIKNLKIGYNRVFGYYIEVTRSYQNLVPQTYIRKQTLANCERYITQELKDLETKVLTATEKSVALEAEIFNEVRRFVATTTPQIQQTADAISMLDFIAALSETAAENRYVCPEITMDGRIQIKNGRHPVVEQMLKDALFVPNDTLLDTAENRMMIITGPNMAGKSTYMRQVALIVIMAQIGSFVPADSASISICDQVFTRVGASDDLAAGQSTFMVEMSEVAHILKRATPKSLVILDEIGRGTSTFDGMSIAKAVVAELVNNKKLGCKTLFATHYHELTDMEGTYPGVRNYNIAVKKRGDDITFLRKIVRGGADESYGIEVAKLAGVPDSVVDAAKIFLQELSVVPAAAPSSADKQEEPQQLGLFSVQQENPLREAVAAVDLDTLTPIEALNKLYELKKML